jgi:hypothetical protein
MKGARFLAVAVALGFWVLAACSSGGNSDRARGEKLTIAGGLEVPESVLYDSRADLYLVSNINGSPFGADARGFIARIRPDGSFEKLKWIDGAAEDVTLNAPKGMAIVGDVLHVADVTAVRKFERTSGKPLGEIPIAGATFLNDVAAALDGTIYVSDTGLAEGFAPSGSDAIYAISPAGEVRTIARGTDLAQPNGLLVDGDSVAFVSWKDGTLRRVDREGKIDDIAKLPENQLDGVVRACQGHYLVSSWAGRCVYRVGSGGKVDVALADLADPADLGYDSKRTRILVPLFNEKKVLVVPD